MKDRYRIVEIIVEFFGLSKFSILQFVADTLLPMTLAVYWSAVLSNFLVFAPTWEMKMKTMGDFKKKFPQCRSDLMQNL